MLYMYTLLHFSNHSIKIKFQLMGIQFLFQCAFASFHNLHQFFFRCFYLNDAFVPSSSLRTAIIVEKIGRKCASDAIGIADIYDIIYRY